MGGDAGGREGGALGKILRDMGSAGSFFNEGRKTGVEGALAIDSDREAALAITRVGEIGGA